ncbi:MAG: PAS domain-containing protein [Gemmatimonas sp.]
MDTADDRAHDEWPRGGGDTGARIRAFDWSRTSLGPISSWSQPLRTVVDLVLHSAVPKALLWGRDGILIYNDAYAVIAGDRHPHLLGASVFDAWPEVAEFNREVIEAAFRGEALSFNDQCLVLHRNGQPEPAWFNLDYSPVADENGNPAGVLAIVFETTESVRAEAALRASEQRLRLVADALPVLISFIDSGEVYRFANQHYQRWLGVPPEQVVGRTIRDLFGDESYAARKPYIDRALAGETVEFEAYTIWPNGRIRDNEIHYIPAIENGCVVGFYAFVLDITDRKRADAALRQLFERSPSFMAIMRGPAHVFEFVNEAYQQLIGQREVLGRPFHEAFPDVEGQGFYELLDQVYETRQPYVGRTVPALLQRPEGGRELRYIDFVFHPLFGPREDVTGVFVQGYEVTERVKAERALRDLNETLETQVAERTHDVELALERLRTESRERERAEEALRQSQKMEAVGQLTGGIAHDFNNLLQGIVGSLGMISRRIEQHRLDDAARFIAAANTAANRAAALIHRLLAFSRRQPLAPRSVAVNDLASSMQELLQRAAGESITIDLRLTRDLWPTLCDPNQLENAILNLAINARDAMPDGGRLTIATRNVTLTDPGLAHTCDVDPGHYVAVDVCDTGIGMPADILSRAFDPFFTTKPSGQGTGLGLSMVYGFARQSGGTTKIESRPGAGTTVSIYLPRHVGAATAEEAPTAAEPAAAEAHGETVLVVEDEAIVRGLAVDVLQELGYRVLEAEDGRTALEIVESTERLDLIVTDVGLPGLTGRQLAEAARARRPDVKILFMTGYADTADTTAFQRPGMHLMTKPFPMEALAARVHEIIEGPAGVTQQRAAHSPRLSPPRHS